MVHKLIHPQVVPRYMKAPSAQLAILLPSEYNYHLSQTFLPSCMRSIRSHHGYICTSRLNSTNKYSQALEISLSIMFVRMTPSTASIRASHHSSQHLRRTLQEPAVSRNYPMDTAPFLKAWKFNSIRAGWLGPFGFSVESGPGHANLQAEMYPWRFVFCTKSPLRRKWKPMLLLKIGKEENLKVTDPSAHSKELFPLHLPCYNQIQMGLVFVCH